MKLKYDPIRQASGERDRILEAESTTAGLSSPQQLIEITIPLSVKVDQTAAGSSLIIFKPAEVVSDLQQHNLDFMIPTSK